MKTAAILTTVASIALAGFAATAGQETSPPAMPTSPPTTAVSPPAVSDAPADCNAAPAMRAPDARCGEPIDGRDVAASDHAVGRAALAVPRVAVRVVLWPVVATTDVVEHYRLLDWMQALLTTDDGLVGVRPVVNYATGFVPSVGARLFYRRLPGHHEISAHFETAGASVLLGRLHFRTLERMGFFFDATWNKRQDRLFAGTGANSAANLTAAGQGLGRYGSNALGADARWSHRLPARLVVLLHADVQRRIYQDTTVTGGPPVATLYGLPAADCAAIGATFPCVNPLEMPGFANGLKVLHGGGALGVDLRDRGREGAGFSAFVDGTVARGVAGDPSEHATLSAESVLALGGINRTLLLRGRAAMVNRLGNAPIPFEELVSPSGQAGMRGFPEGRFRGESGVVGSAEYRWYISSYLDASLFSDLGTVAGHNFSGLAQSQWFPTYGVGLRWFRTQGAYWDATPVGGFQVAYSPDYGVRLILSMASF